ncbi:MAG: formate dehydrogenase subunit gamma [Desulfobacterales bacterium]
MARKNNESPLEIDFTSFIFTYKCGVCHPGGGAAEYDRNGNRYDQFAADPKNGIIPGGENNLDGDYFKSNWAESGVLEADCLICHLKDYNNQKRKEQIQSFNFRWAATAGAGFGEVQGSIGQGEKPKVTYDLSIFRKDGKVVLPVIKEPLNENCLFCHRETDWKKRGSSYTHRTDVHIRAGLRCVDCHLTGRNAEDPRIRGREEHQIGKGDDPGNFVRDDLDDTLRRCEDCHLKGVLNAPVIKHQGLPPEHLTKIACQACHIPWRQVKAALVQDASVFNNSPRIEPPSKRIWSFYGPDIRPWNYYGDSLSYPEGLQPSFQFRPVLGWYKGKIYPLNRVYTLWVGIKTKGEKGIHQPYMKDIFMMWNKHMADPDNNFPQLKNIQDDNLDGFPEVDRAEEIQALLAAVRLMLKQKGDTLEGKEVVFVDGNRFTLDGVEWESIAKQPYEYSPYGSVFKFSHDITPAKNALGAGGCTDCHGSNSDFFFKEIMAKPFNDHGEHLTENNASFLGYSSFALGVMTFRHETLKPLMFWGLPVIFVLLIFHYVIIGPNRSGQVMEDMALLRFGAWERIIHYGLLVLFFVLSITGLLTFFAIPFSSDTIEGLNTIHRYCGYLFLLNILLVFSIWLKDAVFAKYDLEWLKKFGGYFGYRGQLPSDRFNAGQKIFLWTALLFTMILGGTGLTIIYSQDSNLILIASCLHDGVAFIFILAVMVHIYLSTLANPGTLMGIFEGKVSRSWAKKHHPIWEANKIENK